MMDFAPTDRITGEVLALKNREALSKNSLNFRDCRGQVYAGALNMAAQSGGQGILLAENSKATYVHRPVLHMFLTCVSANM